MSENNNGPLAREIPVLAASGRSLLPNARTTDEVITELIKRGATMEQIASLKDPTANTPEEALNALKAGNARFYSGTPQRQNLSVNERRAQIIAQTPFAVVLGCADSRVPVEIIFDQGPGDIFGIRVAGNVVEPGTLGSIEYAVRHLKVHLIVILGHEGCGAVAAAMQDKEQRDAQPENVRFLLDRITPSVANMPPIRDAKARMREALVANVLHQKSVLLSNPVAHEAIERGQIEVVGAIYEIGSGAVDFLEDT
jgi:carbonic anhydrase